MIRAMKIKYEKNSLFLYKFAIVAVGVFFKVLVTFSLSKLIALELGPGEFSKYGQYYVALSFLYTLANFGLVNAYTVYFSSDKFHINIVDRKNILYAIAFLGGAGVGVFVVFFLILNKIFFFLPYETSYRLMFFIFLYCVGSPLGCAMMAAAVAENKYGRQQVINVGGGIFSVSLLLISSYLMNFDVEYAVIVYCVGFLFPLFFLKRKYFFYCISNKKEFFDALIFLKPFVIPGTSGAFIGSFALMAVVAIVRDRLLAEHSGTWFAIWRLSEASTGLIITIASTIFLPRMVKAKENINREIYLSCIAMLILYVPLLILFYFYPSSTLEFFFSSEFSKNVPNLSFQIFGDLLKLFCAAKIMKFSAMAMPKNVLITEIIFSSIFFSASYILISNESIMSVLIAYFSSYAILFIVLTLLFKNKFN